MVEIATEPMTPAVHGPEQLSQKWWLSDRLKSYTQQRARIQKPGLDQLEVVWTQSATHHHHHHPCTWAWRSVEPHATNSMQKQNTCSDRNWHSNIGPGWPGSEGRQKGMVGQVQLRKKVSMLFVWSKLQILVSWIGSVWKTGLQKSWLTEEQWVAWNRAHRTQWQTTSAQTGTKAVEENTTRKRVAQSCTQVSKKTPTDAKSGQIYRCTWKFGKKPWAADQIATAQSTLHPSCAVSRLTRAVPKSHDYNNYWTPKNP